MPYIQVGGQLHVPAALTHRKEVQVSFGQEVVKDIRTGFDALEKPISSLCHEPKLDAMLTERCVSSCMSSNTVPGINIT